MKVFIVMLLSAIMMVATASVTYAPSVNITNSSTPSISWLFSVPTTQNRDGWMDTEFVIGVTNSTNLTVVNFSLTNSTSTVYIPNSTIFENGASPQYIQYWINSTGRGYGIYNITAYVQDGNGNNATSNQQFTYIPQIIAQNSLTYFNQNNFTINNGDFNNTNFSFQVVFNSPSFTVFTFNTQYYNQSVYNYSNYSLLGNFYSIYFTVPSQWCALYTCVSDANVIENSISWAYLAWYPNMTYLQNNSLNIFNLRLISYNTSTNSWQTCSGSSGGANSTGNYIWCNATHLSSWGIVDISSQSTTTTTAYVPTQTQSQPQQQSSGGSSGGGYYIPITTQTTTQAPYIIQKETLDCSSVSLPRGWVCNSTGVYGVQPIVNKFQSTQEIPKPYVPMSAYFIFMGATGLVALMSYLFGSGRFKKWMK